MPMGNPGYIVSLAAVVTYPFQEDLVDLYHGPSIHSDAAEDAVQGQIQALSKYRTPKFSLLLLLFISAYSCSIHIHP